MAQEPARGRRRITSDLLRELLQRAKSDPGFRDKLLGSPAETLDKENISADRKWVAFFKRLKPENFESEIHHKMRNDPEGEAEAEADA